MAALPSAGADPVPESGVFLLPIRAVIRVRLAVLSGPDSAAGPYPAAWRFQHGEGEVLAFPECRGGGGGFCRAAHEVEGRHVTPEWCAAERCEVTRQANLQKAKQFLDSERRRALARRLPGWRGYSIHSSIRRPRLQPQRRNQPPSTSADQRATTHILDGDATGGGHAPGTGVPGKSEFPAGWSRDRIMDAIWMSQLTRRRRPRQLAAPPSWREQEMASTSESLSKTIE